MADAAFVKTSNPWWTMDATPTNIVAQLALEKPKRENVWFAPSATSGQIVCIVWKGV